MRAVFVYKINRDVSDGRTVCIGVCDVAACTIRDDVSVAPVDDSLRAAVAPLCARLKMLKDGNPLGLVYIPYALPALKIVGG